MAIDGDLRTVKVPELGDGVILRYSNRDLQALQNELGDQMMAEFANHMDRLNLVWMKAAFKHGLKKDGKPFAFDFDEYEGPIADLREKIMDAMQLCISGELYKDYITRIFSSIKPDQAEGENPLLSSPAS